MVYLKSKLPIVSVIPMVSRLLKPHPFRLLLSLEWILIGLTALRLFGFGWFHYWELGAPDLSLLILDWLESFILLALFGLMGLRLPSTPLAKALYLATAIGLIYPVAFQFPDSTSPLFIVLLLRSCLIFRMTGRWFMAGTILLIYLLVFYPFFPPFWLIPEFELFPHVSVDQQLSADQQAEIIPETAPSGDLQLGLSSEQAQQSLDIMQDEILLYSVESTLTFGLVLLFVLLLVNSLVRERQGRRQLATAYEKLYQYSLQIEDQATLNERTRIARDIHDSLGHLLTTQSILLQNAELSLLTNSKEASTFLGQSRQILTNALEELRQSVRLLRADVLQGRSLEAAISSLLDEFHRTAGICPTLEIALKTPLSNPIQVAVYRIVEESLTNIRKYSVATQVSIRIKDEPSPMKSGSSSVESVTDSAQLLLQIEDNGIGFHVEQNAAGFGVRGMRERAASLGGQFQIFSQPGAGCLVTAIFPLPRVVV